MIRINQIKISVNQQNIDGKLKKKAAELLRIRESEIRSIKIVRQSIDARKKPELYFSYTVDVEVPKEDKVCKQARNPQVSVIQPVKYHFPAINERPVINDKNRPVIVGTGPAGLFCGLYLARAGFRPVLLERGRDVDTRMKDVNHFWATGELNPQSNVQFGEGGAGTFSDGKLNTLVKDKYGRNLEVLKTFVAFGAKESIIYDAKPHIGTDVLCNIVKKMRMEIIRLGGEVRFGATVTGLQITDEAVTAVVINEKEELPCSKVVLAIGHSARDTFQTLYDQGIAMEAKPFAVGFRVEHPQSMINLSQYGKEDAGVLGAAPYKVTAQTSTGRAVYSFCMCPGGYVVDASSEPGRLAVNGMSYSGRDGANANSAIIVAVSPEDYGAEHPLAGIEFQRRIEERAYQAGAGKIPVQRYGDFKSRVEGGCAVGAITDSGSDLLPMHKGGYRFADLTSILPSECNVAFVEGMEQFGQVIAGFDRTDAILSGVESRTSSPVRILRGENLQSQIRGLYPCGEGAGYAGGITSAAMDGIRVAEAVALSLKEEAQASL